MNGSHVEAVTPNVLQNNPAIGLLKASRIQRQTVVMDNRKTYPEIADRLRQLREAFSDMNRKDWALSHGFNPTQYTNWENGTRRIALEAAEALANRYGLSLDWIYIGRWVGLSEESATKLRSLPRSASMR